jgi:hypothetical protein
MKSLRDYPVQQQLTLEDPALTPHDVHPQVVTDLPHFAQSGIYGGAPSGSFFESAQPEDHLYQ